MSAVGPGPASPESVDLRLVAVYLNDHLAGSVAGSHRFERVARSLRGTPVGPVIARIAVEVAEEREELRGIIERLDVPQNRVKQALAWVGERLARVKAAREGLRTSPMSTLLAVELLRSALVGKLGGWQTLHGLGSTLPVDPDRMEALQEQTQRQIRDLDEVHAYVRVRALAGRSERRG